MLKEKENNIMTLIKVNVPVDGPLNKVLSCVSDVFLTISDEQNIAHKKIRNAVVSLSKCQSKPLKPRNQNSPNSLAGLNHSRNIA